MERVPMREQDTMTQPGLTPGLVVQQCLIPNSTASSTPLYNAMTILCPKDKWNVLIHVWQTQSTSHLISSDESLWQVLPSTIMLWVLCTNLSFGVNKEQHVGTAYKTTEITCVCVSDFMPQYRYTCACTDFNVWNTKLFAKKTHQKEKENSFIEDEMIFIIFHTLLLTLMRTPVSNFPLKRPINSMEKEESIYKISKGDVQKALKLLE